MSSKKKRKTEEIANVDCRQANRGVWLVKVPKYLSEHWQNSAGAGPVGRLKINSKTGEVVLISGDQKTSSGPSNDVHMNAPGPSQLASRRLISMDPAPIGRKTDKPKEIPREHRFVISDINNQTVALFSEDKSGVDEDEEVQSGKLAVEGRVVKRAECRPPSSADYMKMKAVHMEEYNKPSKAVQQMDKAAIKFKPIAIHAEDVAKQKAKKEGIKSVRLDKDTVTQLVFEAFEQHQYYKLVDLAKLTKQPPGYIKEILNDIGRYNTTPPHKFMWELKPEYRHYDVKPQSDPSV